MRSRLAELAVIFCLLGPAWPTFAIDWNQWRGPARDGIADQTPWPEALTNRLKLVWEQPLSPSYSGPIVHEGLVVTTETIDKSTERVSAYELGTGKLAWEVQWPGAMAVPFFAASNGDWIRSTPVCSEGRLVVLGMRDLLVCLNPKDGSEFWRVDFPAQIGTPLPAFGGVCSPLVDQGAVYVQTGGAVVKVSLSDGSLIWKTLENSEGMMTSGAFSSPVIATLCGQRQLIVQTRLELCGVDLESGQVLWKQPIETFRGMNILTPLIIGDQVFTSAYNGRSQMFRISHDSSAGWSVAETWEQNSQGYMSSPIRIGNDIYMHLKNERVTNLNAADGKVNWTSQPMGKYWSLVTNGSQILSLNDRGELRLIRPSSTELQIVDELEVAEDSWAHLAIQDNQVIIRDLNALKVFRWE
jgi:outer membrane protein assembly factor BamB